MPENARTKLGNPPFVAVYLAVCLVFFAAIAGLVWADRLGPFPLGLKRTLFKLYSYVACGGGLGAVVYCVRGFYKHYSLGDYDPKYVYWYLFRPWLGAVLGGVSYLLLTGGLLAFGNAAPATDARAKALFVAVAFLAGFSANEFIMKVNALAKTLFGVDKPEGEEAGAAGASG